MSASQSAVVRPVLKHLCSSWQRSRMGLNPLSCGQCSSTLGYNTKNDMFVSIRCRAASAQAHTP